MKRTKFPIELICSKDELRPAMTGVLIDNGYAIATDGSVLVIMSLKDMDMSFLAQLNGKIIKADVFKRISNSKLSVSVKNDQIIIDGDTVGSPFIDERFPDCRRVLSTENSPVEVFSLNADHLARIQKAFNTVSLRMSFGKTLNSPISVKPEALENRDFRAICMPVFTDPDTKPFTIKAPPQLETA